MAKLTNTKLNRIAQAQSAHVAAWHEGVSLANHSGNTIEGLMKESAADRWRLAFSFRTQATKLLSIATPQYRSAISRYYYAMYHSMRACVYIENQGDDHEAHSKLPLKIPPALDPAGALQTALKNARLLRNRADYEAYPKPRQEWKQEALQIKADATLMLAQTKAFLLTKGCPL